MVNVMVMLVGPGVWQMARSGPPETLGTLLHLCRSPIIRPILPGTIETLPSTDDKLSDRISGEQFVVQIPVNPK